jgi:anti-anti-sigma factor
LVPSPRHANIVKDNVAQLRRDGSRSILQLSGELDVATAWIVDMALGIACRGASVEVIVDLSDVQYFDTVTIGVFDRANLRLNQTGRRLTLVGVSPQQEKVLRICELDHLLSVAVCRTSTRPFRALPADS